MSVLQVGGLGLSGPPSGYDSSLETFVDGFYTEEACFGVDFANSSLLYVLIALDRTTAAIRWRWGPSYWGNTPEMGTLLLRH